MTKHTVSHQICYGTLHRVPLITLKPKNDCVAQAVLCRSEILYFPSSLHWIEIKLLMIYFKLLSYSIFLSYFHRAVSSKSWRGSIMGRKKIQISRILDQRNRQVRLCYTLLMTFFSTHKSIILKFLFPVTVARSIKSKEKLYRWVQMFSCYLPLSLLV